MGTLNNHDPMIPASRGSRVTSNPSTNGWNEGSGGAGPHRPVRSGNGSTAGMGSDRLPQGKLDSPKVP